MAPVICPQCEQPARRLKHSLLCGCGFKIVRAVKESAKK
ncbi:hypothetical protein GGR02_002850 [Anoxybacillus voinovskiensis]|uniref:Uncharacterized protein n=1 Tax=Anoxybacteroides voinovskiense TaxID=230470 RepID=A0A840DZY1_9BACL|nr:hypothetical protein [Anoxybacillus voinovskiensis]